MMHADQLTLWLDKGYAFTRRYSHICSRPVTFNMSTFFHQQGFMAAVQQEARKKNVGWALDDLTFITQVRKDEKLRGPPDDGVYLTGLSLVGASWDMRTNSLTTPKPREQFVTMPIVWLSAVPHTERTRIIGERKMASIPCYSNPTRSLMLFGADLNALASDVSTWALAGTALLCSRD